MSTDRARTRSWHVMAWGSDFPAWSPDGKSIAFTDTTDRPPTRGRLRRPLSRWSTWQPGTGLFSRRQPPEVLDQARWSGDGQALVFQIERFDAQGRETGAAIATVSAAGGSPNPLTPFDLATYPDWNRQTNQIVFTTHDVDPAGGHVGIFTAASDGSGWSRCGIPVLRGSGRSTRRGRQTGNKYCSFSGRTEGPC